jgi:BirA family transcriptional regulator, biotin operon repressor / biotin---[acetyl-CoA-carboxylase] ligase
LSLGQTLAREFSSATLLVFDELESTLDESRIRTAASIEPCWIVALTQTRGRGRRGREWQAPAGNLSLTGHAFHNGPIAALPQLSFVAALAAYDCAASLCANASDAAKLSLKWPNDLLFDGRKLAGLLLESGRGFAGRDWVSVSIGMNLTAAPATQSIGQAAASLSETGAAPSPKQAAEAFAACFVRRLNVLAQDGFAAIRAQWLERASGLGQSIWVRLPDENLHGVFKGLNEDGGLLLELADGGERVITAGDVFFSPTGAE